MAPNSGESKPAYQKDEKALCFHGELLYEAKILDIQRQDAKDKTSPYEYRVHYKGWKNTWDDWVPQDRLRKNTEENRELALNLIKATKEQSSSRSAKPATSTKGRKGQASDLGSGRGSEERNSSVPARGTKRARENDIEKKSASTSAIKKGGVSNQVKKPAAKQPAKASSSGEISQDDVVAPSAVPAAPVAPALPSPAPASADLALETVEPSIEVERSAAVLPAAEVAVEGEVANEQQIVESAIAVTAVTSSSALPTSTQPTQQTQSAETEADPSRNPGWMVKFGADSNLDDFLEKYRVATNDVRAVLVLKEVPEVRQLYLDYIKLKGEDNFKQHQSKGLTSTEVLSVKPPRDGPEYLQNANEFALAPLTQTHFENIRHVSQNIRQHEKRKTGKFPTYDQQRAENDPSTIIPPQLKIPGVAQQTYLTHEGQDKVRADAKRRNEKLTNENFIVLSNNKDAVLPDTPLEWQSLHGLTGDATKVMKRYEAKHVVDKAAKIKRVEDNKNATKARAALVKERLDIPFMDHLHRMDHHTQGMDVNGATIPSLHALYAANSKDADLGIPAPEPLPQPTMEHVIAYQAANVGLTRQQKIQVDEEITREKAVSDKFIEQFKAAVQKEPEDVIQAATILYDLSGDGLDLAQADLDAAQALIDLSRSRQPQKQLGKEPIPKRGRGGRKPPAAKRPNQGATESDKAPATKKAPKPEKEVVQPTRVSARTAAKRKAKEMGEGTDAAAPAQKKQKTSVEPSTSHNKKRKADEMEGNSETAPPEKRQKTSDPAATTISLQSVSSDRDEVYAEQCRHRAMATDHADDPLNKIIMQVGTENNAKGAPPAAKSVAPDASVTTSVTAAAKTPAANVNPARKRGAAAKKATADDVVKVSAKNLKSRKRKDVAEEDADVVEIPAPPKGGRKRKAQAEEDDEVAEVPAKRVKLTVKGSKKEATPAPSDTNPKSATKAPAKKPAAATKSKQATPAPEPTRRSTRTKTPAPLPSPPTTSDSESESPSDRSPSPPPARKSRAKKPAPARKASKKADNSANARKGPKGKVSCWECVKRKGKCQKSHIEDEKARGAVCRICKRADRTHCDPKHWDWLYDKKDHLVREDIAEEVVDEEE